MHNDTGDAYPEMNNILELCKIFHCHMNDLVNDSIIDIDSLDEETKMSVVKFKREQQSKMKGLSKAISIIAKIGRIACMISIPIIIASMIISGIVIHKADIKDNEITWNGNDIISITEINHKVSLAVNNEIVIDIINQNDIMKMKYILENHPKAMVIGYVETGFLFLILSLVFMIMILKSLENLFRNINSGDTPFTLENVGYIKRIAYLMIVVTVLPNIGGVLFEILLNMDLDIGFELFDLVEILFLFSIAYIFQYGYEIQLDSKEKMYGAEFE